MSLAPRARLEALRALMSASSLAAYVIPSSDAHFSEYTPERDKRRAWLTDFSGSAGTAVVTQREGRLWTDGRYYLQATQQMDPSLWVLMRDRLPGTPSVEDWLAGELAAGERVGVDPELFCVNALRRMERALTVRGVSLCAAPRLVDAVWGGAQPPPPSAPFAVHPEALAGEASAAKRLRVGAAVAAAGADALLVTSLDDVAWLLNVRGGDVEHCPVGLAHAIVRADGGVVLAADAGKVTPEVAAHLGGGVTVVPYGAVEEHLRGFSGGRVWADPASANGALFAALAAPPAAAEQGSAAAAPPLPPPLFLAAAPARALEKASPIPLMKAVKNGAEIAGMRAAHVRDGAVLCAFFAWLEGALARGEALTEFTAAARLDAMRRAAAHSRGLSFDTIMGWRANGAVIHYRPEEGSALRIEGRGLLLCDSGGQYADGTTDVTRTLCLGGPPTEAEARAYTAVLQGHIALSRARFPSGTGGVALDALARAPLWAQGLDYRHGTGHGVGAFLNVHEGPQGLASVPRHDYAGGLLEHMTITDEPGCYIDGAFGVRIENVLVVKKAAPPERFGGDVWLEFEPLTCVPIGTAALLPGLLTREEAAWLNAYNARCRDILAPLLAGDADALAWLEKEARGVAVA